MSTGGNSITSDAKISTMANSSVSTVRLFTSFTGCNDTEFVVENGKYFFHNGNDNTGKYLRVLNSNGEIEFVDVDNSSQIQANWGQTDWNQPDYILNKPEILSSIPSPLVLQETGPDALLVLAVDASGSANSEAITVYNSSGGEHQLVITRNGKIKSQVLAGTGTRPLVANEDGTIAVGEARASGALPTGTNDGEMPRWNGTEWVITDFIRVDNDAYIHTRMGNGTSNQQVMVDAFGILYPTNHSAGFTGTKTVGAETWHFEDGRLISIS